MLEKRHTSTNPKFPHIEVPLSGREGNVFAILGRTTDAMKSAKVVKADIDAYVAEAINGDYDHALQTTMRTVTTT